MSWNLQRIIVLADGKLLEGMTALGMGGDTDLTLAVQKAQEEKKRKALDEAAGDIIQVMEKANGFVQAQLQSAMNLEAQAKVIRDLADQVGKAMKFGLATKNFIPVLVQMGENVGPVSSELKKVPKDWVAPEVIVPPATPTPSAAPANDTPQ